MHDWSYPALLVPALLLIGASWIVIIPSMLISFAHVHNRPLRVRINLRIMQTLSWGGAINAGALATIGAWQLARLVDTALSDLDNAPLTIADFCGPAILLLASHFLAKIARLHRDEICTVRVLYQGHFNRVHAARAILLLAPLLVIALEDQGSRKIESGYLEIAATTTRLIDKAGEEIAK